MAQLVARLVRNEKVGGSNPPSSTTGRHSIRMSVFVCLRALVRCLLLRCRWCFGRRIVCLWAWPLCVLVGGGLPACCLLPRQISGRRAACPPARRPRCELRSARRLEARPGPAGLAAASNRSGCLCVARPGPAAAHQHRSQVLRSLRHLPHRRRLVAVSSLARPRRRPRAPQPGPPVPPVPSTPVGPACWCVLGASARGPAALLSLTGAAGDSRETVNTFAGVRSASGETDDTIASQIHPFLVLFHRQRRRGFHTGVLRFPHWC